MTRNNSVVKRFLSVILVLSFLTSFLSGCSEKEVPLPSPAHTTPIENSPTTTTPPIINTEEIVDAAVETIIENTQGTKVLSTRWEDYVGDPETFIYGLIINQLRYKYDVFPASIDLSNGTTVYGIAYTDYTECYVSDDESVCCFEAGFVPYCGEPPVPDDDFNSGLQIQNLDYSDPTVSFVFAFGSSTFTEHCVVYGQYVKYGVNENGQVFYETTKYQKGECDEELGSLYSYDEARFVFDVDVGTYINVTGTSLYGQIDYSELENEINRILDEQDANFVSVDIESCAYLAQEAVTSYLLSLQDETFLGYNVEELVTAAKELDPLECYRLTKEGLITVNLDYDGGASELTKWLVGSACVIVTAVAFVGSVVFIECPPLSALSSAMAGTAIEIFMQVVISGETVDNINWGKVALAAATGAVSGFLGPYIYATTAGAGYFLADSALDALLGGIEHAVYAWMDGADCEDVIKSFGYGFALGFALSAGFKAAGAVAGKLFEKLSPGVAKLAERVFPRLTGRISSLSSRFGSIIYGLKKAADSTVFHSKYISRKLALRQLSRLIEDGSDELIEKALTNLSNTDIVDSNGMILSKEQLRILFDSADDGSVLAYFKKGDELVQIVKKNGMIGIVFDPTKYQTVTLPMGLVSDRGANFEEAAKLLKEQWLSDPSLIPDSLAEAIASSGVALEDMMPNDIVSIISDSRNGWVMHENIDMESITLVPRWLHDKNIGGISHMGGVGLHKFVKSHMGTDFFERLLSAAATGLVQATS